MKKYIEELVSLNNVDLLSLAKEKEKKEAQ